MANDINSALQGTYGTPSNTNRYVTDDDPRVVVLENVAASKLIGRGSAAGAGIAQEITLGTGLSMSGTTLDATGGLTHPQVMTRISFGGF